MDISLQTRLLRVLETGQFMKIGSTTLKHVDVRVIAATNRDLEQEIVNGNFREDLFYRLSSFHIHLPPLREWWEDISLFVREFVSSFSKNKEGKASDIRKIHGSHKTIPMERKCQEVKEYGKKMFSCYGGGKYWTINLCRCRCWNYLKIRGIILDWT